VQKQEAILGCENLRYLSETQETEQSSSAAMSLLQVSPEIQIQRMEKFDEDEIKEIKGRY